MEVQGNFELVHYADPKNINLIDCQNQKIIPLCNDDFDTYKNNFDNGLGLNSDQVFATLSGKKNKNTRKITIPYIGNFDNTNYQNSDYINLIPIMTSLHSLCTLEVKLAQHIKRQLRKLITTPSNYAHLHRLEATANLNI